MFRRSHRWLIALPLLLLSACTMWKEQQHPDSFKNVTRLEDYERTMWKAVQAGDWTQVRAHMSESFVQMSPAGPRDREAALQHYQHMQLEDVSLGEFQTRPNGADMVVTYSVTLRGRFEGKPVTSTAHVLTVWQSVKRGWVEIAQSVQ